MIAVELYTLREHLRDADAIAAGLRRVREIGYDGVELAGLGPIEPERLAELLRENSLTPCSAHVPWERIRDQTDAVAEDCRTWDCTHVAVPFLGAVYRNADGYAQFAADASAAGRRLRDAGIRLSYHNHAFEMQRYNGESGLEIIYRASDPELLGSQLDTYWVQYGGGSPSAWIRRLTGRAPTVHVKDMDVSEGEPVMAEVGEGNLDWLDVLAACRESGVEWLVVEQDVCRRDPFESLAISRRNLTALGAG
jgi:sugar phosphate isomerase/epimerase